MTSTLSAAQPRRLPRWAWVIIIPLGIILILLIVLALLPLATDTPLPEDQWGVGAVNIEPSTTGLLREWPAIEENYDPEMAHLGYQLFFDPVMSGDNARSCASCHHPDWGFSEPRPLAVSNDNREAIRHTPTLWNTAYGETFFWDGPADSLEAQAMISLTSDMELHQDPAELIRELGEIEGYQDQFEAVFEDGLTEDNVTMAIAAFERTLISDGAAFDDYAAGNFDSLTTQQRRGLATFRSAGTRCFECHSSPTFTDGTFAVVGVSDNGSEDRGQGAIEDSGIDYAFKAPTLRNVALRGPYMHNGSEATLEDVIHLYSIGGADFDLAEVDRRVSGFTLSDSDTQDLIAFLFALSDESIPDRFWDAGYVDSDGRIIIPDSVPSGFDPVDSIDNPAREKLNQIAAGSHERPECERDAAAKTLTVQPDGSIQQAVDCAQPGDTILVSPGVYHERVVIDQSDITLRGLVDEPEMCPMRTPEGFFPEGDDTPNWPILDGDSDSDGNFDITDGVIASGNNFKMEFFIVRNYTGNGVLVEGVTGVTLRHVFTSDTGLYGVYPVHSTDVLVECTIATKIHDAGIYVGQSRDIVVRNNLAYDNVTGIEIENSVNADVFDNEVWGNTGGLLVFLLPNISSKVSMDIRVHDNYIHDNNRAKGDARPGSVVALVPVGTGIFVMATDDSEFYNNRIENNNSFGIGVVSLYQAYKPEELGPEVGPLSERNHIHDNTYLNNGTNPDPGVTEAGLPGGDVLWDTTGTGNRFDEPDASVFPPVLPSDRWPDVAQRIVTQLFGSVIEIVVIKRSE